MHWPKNFEEADRRGEELGLTQDEAAFYDALEVNDSAVAVLGDETLRMIAQELVRAIRNNITIDWTVRENVRVHLRIVVKRHPSSLRVSPGQAREGYPDRVGTGRSAIGAPGPLVVTADPE